MISEDGLAYSGNIRSLLHISELKEIIYACNKTLECYEKHEITDEIIAIDNNIQEKESIIKISKNVIKPFNDKTSIYLMYDNNTKYYKIGRSINAKRRERTLQSEKPTIELKYTFTGNIKDESILHDKFKDKRIRGEWFNLNQTDIDYILNYFK